MAHALLKLQEQGYSASDVKCIGITNQRETIVTWDRLTGEPLHPAILWSDARTASTVQNLTEKANGQIDVLVGETGLPLATYFTAVKLRWLLDNVPAVQQAREQDRLCFGTMDSWIIYNLTGGAGKGVIATDVTNASRTMLMNIHTLQWSEKAISFFGFEGLTLPKLTASSEMFGCMDDGSDFCGVPITGCLGDQQAALVGQKCFQAGDAKSTYGTGCFMLFNTGDQPVNSRNGLLSTVAYQFGDQKAYALEGSVAVAGSSLNWLRDNLRVVRDAHHVNELASQVNDAAGTYFVTAFAGLFAPYWRQDARGTICGLTQYTRLEHLCRATLEAVCYQTRAILEAMNKDSGKPLRSLKVDGGMSNSDLCMQIQADVLGIHVDRPLMRESTALGAAIAAGLGAGIWKDLTHLQNVNNKGRTTFEAKISKDKRDEMYMGWQKAIESSFGWSPDAPTASATATPVPAC
ncbi:hypothetical protein BC940DRAFT_239421 [Gongronella butleri]|nr:hypothetical protein BC940DRAFT_239421 [Gongronella butleri]